MTLADFLQPENVITGLEAGSKEKLLKTLSELAGKALTLDAQRILTVLSNREDLGSTGLGQGVAIPHASLAGVEHPFGMLVRLARPVNYDAADDEPVDIVFLLLNPEGSASPALKVLSTMARIFRQEDVLNAIRNADDAAAIYAQLQALVGE